MRRERFTTLASTTLNEPSDITAAQTTIVVDDGSVFPSEGDFRILIDSEIMLVTARSTNSLTVVRGQEGTTGAIHLDNAAVTALLTGGAIEQILNDLTKGYTTRPSFLVQQNGVVKTQSDFTWINQGTATSVDDAKGGIILRCPSEVSHNIRGKVLSVPGTTPYSFTGHCQFGVGSNANGINGSHMGLFFRDSTGKIITMSIRAASSIACWYFTDPTTFSVAIDNVLELYSDRYWLRLEDDGTDLNGYASVDGVTWVKHWSDPRTSKMTSGPTQMGFYCNSGAGSADGMFHFHSLEFPA